MTRSRNAPRQGEYRYNHGSQTPALKAGQTRAKGGNTSEGAPRSEGKGSDEKRPPYTYNQESTAHRQEGTGESGLNSLGQKEETPQVVGV